MPIGRMAGGVTSPPVEQLKGTNATTGRMADLNLVQPGLGRMAPAEEQAAIPTNPLSFIGGLLKNIGTGAVDIVKGLGTLLIQAPIHDTLQLGANILPGEQAIENEPSMLASMARTALPGAWFPGPDLGGKYGSIASDFAHRYGGVDNIARGLYENPLAYVMDALVVADGVGLIGKAGRVGKMAQHLPQLVSDATASKILGPALSWNAAGEARLARYGPRPLASLSRSAGKYEDALKLSRNPLMRYGQNKLYDALSLTPEGARGLFDAPGVEGIRPMTARAEEVISAVEKYINEGPMPGQPLRILRPKVGEFLAQHDQSRFMSMMKVDMQDLSAEAVEELKQFMPANTPDGSRAIDYELATKIDQGESIPEINPNLDPIQIELTKTPEISFAERPQPESLVFDPIVAETLANELTYRASRVGTRKGRFNRLRRGRQESIVAHETPYAGVGGQGGANSFKVAVESLDDAERAAHEVLGKIGYNNNVRAINTLADEANPYHTLSFFGDNASGNTVHLTVGPPGLLYAQEAAAGTFARIASWTAEHDRLVREIVKTPEKAIKDGVLTRMGARIVQLKEELAAAREYLKEEVFADARASFWESKGFVYDPETKAALATRPWRAKHITERWFQEAPSEASYVKMMNSKFTAKRVILMKQKTAKWRKDMQAILEQHNLSGLTPALRTTVDHRNFLDLVHYLEREGLDANQIETILGKSPWLGKGGTRNPAEAAARIAERAENRMWDLWVTEGGAGRTKWQEFSWKTMQLDAKDPGSPGIVPSYMPWLPKSKPSQYAMQTPVQTTEKVPGFFTEDRTGRLFAEGTAELDMSKALPRAARIIYMHDSINSFIRNMTENFARKATQAEAALYRKTGDARYIGEYFFNPKAVETAIKARGRLAAQTILSVPETGDVLGSVLKNLKEWSDEVFKEGVNNLDGELYAIPEHIAKMMEREIKHQFGNNVKLFWDTPMKVWKASVLSLSPRWIVNNLFGNLIFVGLENPGALRHVISQMDRRKRALAEALIGYDPIRVTESGFFHEMKDLSSAVETTADLSGSPLLSKTKGILLGDKEVGGRLGALNAPSRGIQSWSRGVRSMNSYIEEAFRRGIFIDELTRVNLNSLADDFESSVKSLQRGAEKGWTPAEMKYATERVDRVIGNFMRYSPFEQGIVRRFVFPFYGFYRHMANVLFKLPFEHPLKASLFQRIEQMNEVMEGDMPSYLQGTAAVRLGDLFGDDTYLRLKNMNPLSVITDDYGMINSVSPALKIAVERGLGINTFTGDTFDPAELGQNDIVQTHDGQFWKIVRAGDGSVLDVYRTGRPLPSLLQHVGSQFGLTGFIPTFNLYKRSYEQQIASWVGVPITQPKGGTEASLAYDQEVHAEALAKANGGSGFGSFGDAGFGSFGSF